MLRSVLRLQLREAGSADAASLKENDVVCIVAEDACGLIFLQYDAVAVYEHFQSVLAVKLHAGTKLLRDQNAAKLVNFLYESGRFLDLFPRFFWFFI